ncbi:uncharacterized protein METZ01_LOCUS248136 [marine metagenome]|uniref:Uncharacterized protein n=1 Tax=marine metagenome TaxID=408172 RepID=A0A382I7I3_9ZZZZ
MQHLAIIDVFRKKSQLYFGQWLHIRDYQKCDDHLGKNFS